MKRTPVLSAAYDEDMELLLLFLLTSLQQGNDLNETLQKLLAFYRENRELILMLARGAPSAADTAAAGAADRSQEGQKTQHASHEKKDRPPEDSPIVSILEEYLSRSAAH